MQSIKALVVQTGTKKKEKREFPLIEGLEVEGPENDRTMVITKNGKLFVVVSPELFPYITEGRYFLNNDGIICRLKPTFGMGLDQHPDETINLEEPVNIVPSSLLNFSVLEIIS